MELSNTILNNLKYGLLKDWKRLSGEGQLKELARRLESRRTKNDDQGKKLDEEQMELGMSKSTLVAAIQEKAKLYSSLAKTWRT